MKLYKKEIAPSPEKTAEELARGSGLTNGHFPHGFSALASFGLGDVYIDEKIIALQNDRLTEEIDRCLLMLKNESYGEISDDEKDENLENKYFGNGKNLVARYKTSVGVLEIKVLESFTTVELI